MQTKKCYHRAFSKMAPARKVWRMPRSRSAHAHKPQYANLRQLCAEDVANRHYFYCTHIQTDPASSYRIGWWFPLADWWNDCMNETLTTSRGEDCMVVSNQSTGRRRFSRNTGGGKKITREHQCCRVWMQQRLFMTTMISAVIRDAFME